MKNYSKTLILLGLFSTVSFAQTKPSAAKPSNAKPSAKIVGKAAEKTSQKPANGKPLAQPAAKSNAAKDKKAPGREVKQNTKQVSKTAAKPIAARNLKKDEKTSAKPPKINTNPAANKLNAAPTVKPLDSAIVKPTAKLNFEKGAVAGKTYTNEALNFEITLPEEWLISDENLEAEIKKQGINLALETPKAANSSLQTSLNQAANRVNILLTAYKAASDAGENAILRVSVEDLRAVPQVKDAVDYFDLMRQTFQFVKLPPDFKYSETQAERLGKMQFGFLNTENAAGKKRMYATVRRGYALMFTLTYKSEADLAALKDVLTTGNFRLN